MLSAERLAAALVVVAGVLSVISMQYALAGSPAQDFAVAPLRREVTWVMPGGGTWNSGVRQGQQLVEFSHGQSVGDWRLEVATPGGSTISARASAHLEALRATAPFAAGAVFASLFGLLLLARHRALAGATSLAAFGLLTLPVAATNDAVVSTLIMPVAPLAGALWLAQSGLAPWVKRLWLTVVIGTVALWLLSRVWLFALFPAADVARTALTVSALVVAVGVAAPWRTWFVATASHDPPRTVDVAAIAAIIASAIGAGSIAAAPFWIVVPVALALMAAYPLVRRQLGAALEDLLFGGIRDSAAIGATEEERARLAGEIHDGPLQTLAAAITELDELGPTEEAVDLLRDVGAELRAVSAALRPPVLDDLGLGAAVAWLVDQARVRAEADLAIASRINDETGVGRTTRPPAAVELAAFRIVQEALSNAVKHAEAHEIAVTGDIAADSLGLEVRDDGRGIQDMALRDARRSGRLGLPSMRKRASSINAELSVAPGSPRGTLVRLRWRAK